MNLKTRWLMLILLLIAAPLISSCSDQASATKIEPAIVEAVEGTEFNRVILTQKAAERLGIQTEEISEVEINGADELVVPYSAILYGLFGETWVYTQIGENTYTRAPITVDYIQDDMVVLHDGPAVGVEVVTIGVAELFGTDTGVGK